MLAFSNSYKNNGAIVINRKINLIIMLEFSAQELSKFMEMHRNIAEYINLNPIQRGGILPDSVKEIVLEWVDGYSICDHCEGVLSEIKDPPIETFIAEILPKFLEIDEVRLTNGAREGIFAILHSVCKPGNSIIIDKNSHYSVFLAAERVGLNVIEVENNGYPEYKILEDQYAEKIEEIKNKSGSYPELAVVTYPDGNYGNFPDAKKIAEICHEYEIPVLVNAAYAIGRMPISARKLKADFIVGSGHKSMASTGPIGILGINDEWKDVIFRKSWRYKNKEVEFLGCGPRGLAVVTLMASFPHVLERVKKWKNEVEKARYFVKEMENIPTVKQLGVKPTSHDLNFFETPIFYEISKKHKRGRFFLYRELKKRGIIGIKPGLTKNFKLSTYLLTKDEINRVLEAFQEIASLH